MPDPTPPFKCLVREIIHNMAPCLKLRIQAAEMAALQLGAETYLTRLLEDVNLYAVHAKRITVAPKDLILAKRLRQDKVISANVESVAQLTGARCQN